MTRRANVSICLIAGLVAGLLTTHRAAADSMSCGVGLVVVGDHKYDVKKKCGQPASAEQHYIDGPFQRRDRFGRRYMVDGIRVETWVYDFGQHRFTRILRFEDGRLVRIEKTRP